MLTDKIYYVDQDLIAKINQEFVLVAEENWYMLYQNKNDQSYWRLDTFDRLQTQVFIRLDSKENWSSYNDQELRIQLLLKTRGTSDNTCNWQSCQNKALQNLAFCERHAYLEMGVRK